jgi:hypothetical protein
MVSGKNLNFIFIFLFVTSFMLFTSLIECFGVPSFSRQTGMSCTACHNSFPELNSFGRQFKLNGYTLTTAPTITVPDDTLRKRLNLLTNPPIAGMVMSSFTNINKKVPGTQNNNVEFPQQFSLFYAGQVTPHMGAFVQITYDPQSGAIGLDNTDIRYSNRGQLASKDWIYGFTLNNNPTVQDVWNTVPAWRYPFSTSGVAPSPAAATMVEGTLSQQVAGLGTYGLFNNLIYYELSVYRAAPQGAINPPDSTSVNTISGVAPYWRLALQHQFANHYIMIGTYGMEASLFPQHANGTTDKYTDIGIDLQYEYSLARANISVHSSLIRETRTLDATKASGGADLSSSKLNSFKLDGSIYFKKGIGLTLGYFNIAGDEDQTLYGTFNGKPDSNGTMFEISFLPWLNTRFSVQYVMYNKFNGQANNYDGLNRNGSQNNTLYCLAWISF